MTVGGLLIAGGLGLLVWTVVLFDRWGEGTLGVGELLGEPVHLVVHGPYRHMRNPMISAVLCILLGEAAVMASGWLLGWVAIFLALRLTVIRFWEEPHLVRRYGNEYVEYRRHVPRWFPESLPGGNTSWTGSSPARRLIRARARHRRARAWRPRHHYRARHPFVGRSVRAVRGRSAAASARCHRPGGDFEAVGRFGSERPAMGAGIYQQRLPCRDEHRAGELHYSLYL